MNERMSTLEQQIRKKAFDDAREIFKQGMVKASKWQSNKIDRELRESYLKAVDAMADLHAEAAADRAVEDFLKKINSIASQMEAFGFQVEESEQ